MANLFKQFTDRFINAEPTYNDDDYYEDYNEEYYDEPAQEEPQVVNFNQARARRASGEKIISVNTNVSMQVVVSYPANFDDAASLCAKLQDRQTVVVNLTKTPEEITQRIGDFLCGAGVALRCSIQSIADNVIIICPENVKITGDFKQELAANGVDLLSAVRHK